jgi:hypothetical protein
MVGLLSLRVPPVVSCMPRILVAAASPPLPRFLIVKLALSIRPTDHLYRPDGAGYCSPSVFERVCNR